MAKHFYNPVSHLLALLIWISWTTYFWSIIDRKTNQQPHNPSDLWATIVKLRAYMNENQLIFFVVTFNTTSKLSLRPKLVLLNNLLLFFKIKWVSKILWKYIYFFLFSFIIFLNYITHLVPWSKDHSRCESDNYYEMLIPMCSLSISKNALSPNIEHFSP